MSEAASPLVIHATFLDSEAYVPQIGRTAVRTSGDDIRVLTKGKAFLSGLEARWAPIDLMRCQPCA